jgi:serine kinase of HPr protein (carbohydrate metabolism regulator)
VAAGGAMSARKLSYIHANALALGEIGLLLRGPSGSGKSALALSLLHRFDARGDFARLVGDDRVSVELVGGRLIARPHPAIAGQIEARGLGLLRLPYEPACVLHAIVDLAPAGQAPARLPEETEKTASLLGVRLPRLGAEGWGDVVIDRIVAFIQIIRTF